MTEFKRNLIHFKSSDEIRYEKFMDTLHAGIPAYTCDRFILDKAKLNLAQDLFARLETMRDEYLLLVDSLEFYIDFDTHYACVAMSNYTYPLVGEAKDMIAEMMLEADAVDTWLVGEEIMHISFEFTIWSQ